MSADEGFFDGFLDDYFAESEEHLAAAADALLALEKSLGNEAAEHAAVDDLFRYFHTLKAISAMVELRPAEHLAHSLENYLRAIRDHEVELSADGSDVLIDGTHVSAVSALVATRFADAAGFSPATVISTGTYNLMWDLAKSDIPPPRA